MKTIAIDFDGVIHKYSKGWQDGEIYDEAVDGVIDVIKELLNNGHSVFIFSTRNPRQIKKWFKKKYYKYIDGQTWIGGTEGMDLSYWEYPFKVEIIPFWKKFWDKQDAVGITKRKLAAHCYIDDRAITFKGDWQQTLTEIKNFKTYQQ